MYRIQNIERKVFSPASPHGQGIVAAKAELRKARFLPQAKMAPKKRKFSGRLKIDARYFYNTKQVFREDYDFSIKVRLNND